MRYRITILLLIICASLTAIIFKLDQSPNAPSSNSGKADIFGPEIQSADYLQVRSAQLGEYNPRTLEKPQNQPWQIVEPVRWTANPYHLNQILNQIQFLPKNYSFTVSSILNAGQTLDTYGLQNPRLQLTLGWGGQKQTIEFGSPTEMGGKTYLLGPDRAHIYAISQQLEKVLLQSPVYWRSQEVLTLPIIDVNTISLQINDSGNITKIRLDKTDDEWDLQAPINAKANTPLVNNSLNHLQNVKVLQFLDTKASAEAQAALLKPDIRITLHGTRESQTLHLAEPLESGKLYLFAKLEAYPNTPFTVSSTPFRNLRNAQTYFRQKHFLHFKPSTIHNITLSTADSKTSLQKLEGGDWQVQEPGEEPRWAAAENLKVEKLLATLLNLYAIHFPNDAPSLEDLQRMGLETPLQSITLSASSDNKITLHLGRSESNETLYAKLADSPYIYEVPNTITQQLSVEPIHYRLRRLQPNNPIPAEAKLQKFILSSLPDKKQIYEFPKSGQDPPIPPEILQLTDHLKTLSAKDFMKDPFQETFFQGPDGQVAWRYQIATTWDLPPGNDPATISLNLYLTKRENGTNQGAGHPNSNLSFTLEQESVDLLHKVLPGPNLPPEWMAPPPPPKPKPE
jgi:hypothetical protein